MAEERVAHLQMVQKAIRDDLDAALTAGLTLAAEFVGNLKWLEAEKQLKMIAEYRGIKIPQ